MRSCRSCRCRRGCPSPASGSTTPATPRSSPRRSSAADRAVIDRYTRPELGRLWTDQARMDAWREVEIAACEELPGLLGEEGPSAADLEAVRASTFTVEAAQERERVTEHDLAAFVDVLAESAGAAGRWIHFGLTSS